ncbi:hypothetical protein BESB_050370 [Besnoitia besnoiti]|uniref:Uncharacterized protein n=1 Tax=Besnoitia besnoiti TaxID=94643 RepID=A0A2A9MFR7_BESBE|nr:hypothetical protein BESB_050370 [Besnoitia besnoiti]PFH36845.1 hypothetical protein BESB_050370 [Besnoitia besnoiti]
MLFRSNWLSAITYKMRVPYGVKQSDTYRQAKKQTKLASKNARKMKESKGLLLEGKKSSMYMNMMQNTGIAWYRSLQVCKHLEMHWRAPTPPVTARLRERVAQAVAVVKQGR